MGRTVRDPADRYAEKVARRGEDECWPWLAACFGKGYGAFRLGDKQLKAHRYGYELLVGPIPDGMYVCHVCDNPPCQNPAHWFLGTHRDNAVDRESKGRGRYRHLGPLPPKPRRGRARGERAGGAHLTANQVQEIRAAYAAGGRTQQSLAITYGVTQKSISNVVNARTWSHVSQDQYLNAATG